MPSSFSLIATNITKYHGSQIVLGGISLSLGPSSRIGVVGPNGIGKSTLLRVLAGLEDPDDGGVVRRPQTLEVAYLPQEHTAVEGETLLGYLQSRSGVASAAAELDAAEKAIAREERSAADAYSAAIERFVALGGPDFRAHAAAESERVGLTADRLEAPVANLSSGQRARAALASTLLSRQEVLLLDEPTNDLDLEGLDLLASFVAAFDGALVVVSHDRAFLDEAAREILEITEPDHTAASYTGGFTEYLRARREETERLYREHQGYLDERARLTEALRRQERWSEKGVRRQKRRPSDRNKVARDSKIEAAQNFASRRKVIGKRLERLDPVRKPWEGWDLQLSLQAGMRSGDRVLGLDDAVLDRGPFRLGPLSLELHWQDRLAITGPNGSGKTTLLHALTGRLPLTSGRRWVGRRVVLGEIEQERRTFHGAERLLDAFTAATGFAPGEARSLLAKFGLGPDHVRRSSGSLSPGERTRVTLAALVAKRVNLLILDEPTNHLDLPAIEELESALGTFDGTVILVSHDRWLLGAFEATRTLRMEDLGRHKGEVAGKI